MNNKNYGKVILFTLTWYQRSKWCREMTNEGKSEPVLMCSVLFFSCCVLRKLFFAKAVCHCLIYIFRSWEGPLKEKFS